VHLFRVLMAIAMLAAASLTGCGAGNVRTDVVIVNAGEPQNPLIPTNTNDTNGGRIVDRLFAGLMSYDAKGAPTGFTIPVREVRLSAGAEFIVAICGEIMTMPGLPKVPSADAIDVNEQGKIVGLF